MKRCASCNSILLHIGDIKPNTLLVSSRYPSLSPYDGAEYLVVMLLLSMILTLPFWGTHMFFSVLVIAVFGGYGAFLWQRPRPVYRCKKCGAEFYGKSLSPLKR